MINASNEPNTAEPGSPMRRSRLTRERGAVERFALHSGEVYRIAYTAGATAVRRVSRSVVVYEGVSERRRWDGDSTPCLDFALPQGRQLSLLSTQLVDVRPAELNDRGQWVLASEDLSVRRRRSARRPRVL